MKKCLFPIFCLLLVSGCTPEGTAEKQREAAAKPTFLFWCFRKEIVETTYRVPQMTTPAAATYIEDRIRAIPGYVESRADLESRTIAVKYQSSAIRAMNFEEAIALAGFAVNHRPANPGAKLPEGLL